MTAGTVPADERSPATTRANRVVLLLLGLLLLAGGIAGLLAGLGVFGRAAADSPVLPAGLTDFVDRNSGWFWPVVAVVALLVGLLALRWLLAQGGSEHVSELELEDDRSGGRTRLSAAALTGAVEDEIRSYRGVADASARLMGSVAAPRLSLRVRLDGRADPGEVRRRIEREALDHVRAALSDGVLPTRMELVIGRSQPVPVAAPRPQPSTDGGRGTATEDRATGDRPGEDRAGQERPVGAPAGGGRGDGPAGGETGAGPRRGGAGSAADTADEPGRTRRPE